MTTDGPSLPQRDSDSDLFAQIDAVLGSGEYGNVTDRLVEFVRAREAELRGNVEALTSALGRTEANLLLAIHGKPVRDLTETLAENRAALASSPTTHESEEA